MTPEIGPSGKLGHRLVRRWGTRFVDADPTGADFTGTNPTPSDARGATVGDVTWDPGHPRPLDVELADADTS